jgi:hypothetical protein
MISKQTVTVLLVASTAVLWLTGASQMDAPVEPVTFQWLLNAIFTVTGVLCGWILTVFHQTMKDLQKFDFELAEKVHAIELLVAGQYVKKDELHALSVALFSKLDRIEQKLDQKVDKTLI